MAIYAVFLLDARGQLLAAKPDGVQFDSAFLESVGQKESSRAVPGPLVHDMGGGFSLIGLWSGEKPAIVLPRYIVGLVIDTQENQEELKKQLRKITNNVLLKYQSNQDGVPDYLGTIWQLIEAGQLDQLPLEKPVTPTVSNAAPVVSPTPSPVMPSKTNSGGDNFADLQAMTADLAPESKSPDPFSSDSFAADPFANSKPAQVKNAAADPFGGGASKSNLDPFGGSSVPQSGATQVKKSPVIPKPTGGKLAYNPNLFGEIPSKTPAAADPFSDNPFAENPFGDVSPKPSSDHSSVSDEFSDNPFADLPPKKKDEKPTDEFSDNPW
jgi:hypothetical protein